MADLKISELSPAGTLTGAELVPLVQDDATKRSTLNAFATFVAALIIDSAPSALNTLNELAAALGDDPNYAATVTAAIAAKQDSDATLTALAALNIVANSLILGTGSDAFSVVALAANKFLARASTGNLEAKDISDFGLTLVGSANAAAARSALGAAGAVVGKHCVPVMAGWIQPSVSGGCAALASIASAANQPDIVSLDFDPTTQEYAQFSMPLPKSWNGSTFTFVPIWSHPATTTNFGVVWNLQLGLLRNDDAIAANFGTAQTSTDTGGTTNDAYYGPESSAITPAGSAADDCLLVGRISRVTGDGSDNMAVDARLHGILLFMNTDAETDA